MDIRLRLIKQDSGTDRENYLALQKSVALLPEIQRDDEEKMEEWSWKEQFRSKNRLCYVIETMPEHVYCGECAVKNISDEIPEIEIELMKEQQNKGIGYQAIVCMLNQLFQEYGKEKYLAKVEPDNFASQLLFEKLGGVPDGLAEDYKVSDDRKERFTQRHRNLLDENIQRVAEKFGVEAELLLTHVLVYRLCISDVNARRRHVENSFDKKQIDGTRNISKKKHTDVLEEQMEGLERILHAMEEDASSDTVNEMLKEMEEKLLKRMAKLEEEG